MKKNAPPPGFRWEKQGNRWVLIDERTPAQKREDAEKERRAAARRKMLADGTLMNQPRKRVLEKDRRAKNRKDRRDAKNNLRKGVSRDD